KNLAISLQTPTLIGCKFLTNCLLNIFCRVTRFAVISPALDSNMYFKSLSTFFFAYFDLQLNSGKGFKNISH
ncbi:hypothetical protein QN397_16215, partial [Variovorax sp. RTB1]|uniref:hypothetical protein n=1 Tax=Variovorax sp. RTB1 TaxID=3048631 RepID=UPI002B231D1B